MKTFNGSHVPSPGVHLFAGVNFILFLILVSIAARLYDQAVLGVPGYANAPANAQYTIIITLVAATIGLGTTLYGLISVSKVNEITHSIAEAANAITMALMVLASGSAGRSLRSGHAAGTSTPARLLKAMYAFDFILMITMFLYVAYLAITAHRSYTMRSNSVAHGNRAHGKGAHHETLPHSHTQNGVPIA